MPKRSAGPTAERPPPRDGALLHAEVKAFASSLGLAAGEGNGFDDSDFRPELAKRKFSDKGGQQKRLREHANGNGNIPVNNGKKRARSEGREDRSKAPPRGAQPVPQQHRQQPPDAKTAAALKSREWKEAVGPRPGAGAPFSACPSVVHRTCVEARMHVRGKVEGGAAGAPCMWLGCS